MITDNNWVVVFDLDGTLIPGNSFHEWLKSILFMRLNNMKSIPGLILYLKTVCVVICRLMRFNSHAEMKYKIQRAWKIFNKTKHTEVTLAPLLSKLAGEVRPELRATISRLCKARVPVIISTAAPEEYSVPFGKQLGVDLVLATVNDSSAWTENLSERKAITTLAEIKKWDIGNTRILFFTDHLDDLPLMRHADYVVWYGSNEDTSDSNVETRDIHFVDNYIFVSSHEQALQDLGIIK
jgi:phosphoserine phosphatase